MAWENLPMRDRATIIKLGVQSGLRDINSIKETYNKFADGGKVSNDNTRVANKQLVLSIEDDPNISIIRRVNSSPADFVQRLKDPNRKVIKLPNGQVATHKMGWATSDGIPVVFPLVQNINGKLVNFENKGWTGLDSAINRGDTIHMTSPQEAEWFTTHYKNYYPDFNKYADGGMLPALPEYVPIEAQAGLYGGQQGQQVYRDYVQNGPKGVALVSKDTAKRIYSGMSALGYGLQFLGPVGKVVGMALQIPDIISDVDNLSKEQSVSNAASVASDMLRNTEIVKEVWPKPVGRFQLAKRPNIVKKILPFGIIDAAHDGIYSVTGKDIYDIFDSSKEETNKPKITRKKKK